MRRASSVTHAVYGAQEDALPHTRKKSHGTSLWYYGGRFACCAAAGPWTATSERGRGGRARLFERGAFVCVCVRLCAFVCVCVRLCAPNLPICVPSFAIPACHCCLCLACRVARAPRCLTSCSNTQTAQPTMIQFFLLVNKQGQTRLSQYYEYTPVEERVISEAEIIRRCLSRVDSQVKHKHAPYGTNTRTHSAQSWSTRTSRSCTAVMRRCSSSSASTAARTSSASSSLSTAMSRSWTATLRVLYVFTPVPLLCC